MNWLKASILWIAVVGTVVVFGDSMLSLYKVIEFRAAVQDFVDFGLVIFISLNVVFSASLLLFALFSRRYLSQKIGTLGRRCSFSSIGFSFVVLILNFLNLTEWPQRALEGRNYSALWCLVISCIYLWLTRRRTVI